MRVALILSLFLVSCTPYQGYKSSANKYCYLVMNDLSLGQMYKCNFEGEVCWIRGSHGISCYKE